MESYLRLALSLPRDAATVTIARRLLDRALAGIGVVEDCRGDIALALTEACSNAVDHAIAGEEYQVIVTVDRDRCVVEVIDGGVGFDLVAVNDAVPEPTAERGRGLQMIRAVTDGLEVLPVDPRGMAVRMSKNLTWASDATTPWAGRRHDAWAVVAA